MAKELRVSLLQFGSTSDKKKNIDKIKSLIKSYDKIVSNSDILVLPEYSMLDPTGQDPLTIWRVSEEIDGPWVEEFRALASEYGVFIITTLFEKSNDPPRVYNTAVVLSPKGRTLNVYRKTHLFDAYGYRESEFTVPGTSLASIVEVKGFKLALAICFDIRFPEIFRKYAIDGADIVAIPAAWYKGILKEETIRFLARSRAHENTIYVALAIQYGENFTGRSMLVDPLGVVVVDAGIGEKIVSGVVSSEDIKYARRLLPILRLRRIELYKDLCD